MKYILFSAMVMAMVVISPAYGGSETWGKEGSTEPRDPKGPTHLWPIWKK